MADGSLDLLKGTLDLIVLTVLDGGEAMHGFQILDWLRDATEDELVVEEGSLYPALHRMEKRGWISAEWAVSSKGRRAKYYEIRRKGKRALAREKETWHRYIRAVSRVTEAAGG